MGIKGLKSFLQDNNDLKCIDNTSLIKFKNKVLAVDLSILLHRSLYNDSNYISYFINFTLKLNKYYIKPIFVFDGKPPKEKNGVIELRKKNKDKASKKVNLLIELKNKINLIYKLTKNTTISEELPTTDEVFIDNYNENLTEEYYQFLNKKNIFKKLSLHHNLKKKIIHYNLSKHNNTINTEIDIDSDTLSNSSFNLSDSITSNDSGFIDDNDIHHHFKGNMIHSNRSSVSLDSSSVSLDSINEDETYIDELNEIDYTEKYITNLLINCNDENHNLVNVLDEDIQLDVQKGIQKDIKKNSNKSKGIKKTYIETLKKLFNYLHIPYIHINKEADIICKLLLDYNIADSCISDDMDMIPYQCKSIIQNINFSNDNIMVYDFNSILKNLDLTNKQLIDLCICCGTDFNNKLINIKCKEIYKFIKKYKSIENLISNIEEINKNREKTIKIPYQFDYQISRDIFMLKNNDINESLLIGKIKNLIPLNVAEINEKDLQSFFNRSIDFVSNNIKEWSNNEVYTKLNKIYKLFLGDNKTFSNFYKKKNFIPNNLFEIKNNNNTSINSSNSINNINDRFNNQDKKCNFDNVSNDTKITNESSVTHDQNTIFNSNIVDSNIVDSKIVNSNVINSKIVNSNIVNSNIIENNKKGLNSIHDWTLIAGKGSYKYNNYLYATASNISTNINKNLCKNKNIISLTTTNDNKRNSLDKFLIDVKIKS